MNMEQTTNTCNSPNCPLHFHADDSILVNGERSQGDQALPEEQQVVSPGGLTSESTAMPKIVGKPGQPGDVEGAGGSKEHGFTRIIRNFTPS